MSVRTASPRTVAHFSDSEAFGGTERALLQLMGGLDRARWRPVLFHSAVPGAMQLRDEAAAMGVAAHAVPHADKPSRGIAGIMPLISALRRERAVVFHAHQIWSLSCRYGIVAERLRSRFAVPASKITIVPNAAAASVDVRPEPRLRAELTDGGTRSLVLTVARLDAQKGITYLLEAAASVPNAVFAIAGDGPDRAALAAHAAALGVSDRVRFLGHRRDVPALLAVADLFVLPSLYEGLPLAALEAMAAGVPVIATAIGGTSEIVRDGETGTLVPPEDGPALAAAVTSALSDRERTGRLAGAARLLVRREYSVQSMVRAVSGVYEELLGE